MHICIGKITIIGSDNGLSPGRRQAIIWTNAGILLIRPLETNFSESLIGIQTFSFKKMHLKMSSAKCRSFVSASICVKQTDGSHMCEPSVCLTQIEAFVTNKSFQLLSHTSFVINTVACLLHNLKSHHFFANYCSLLSLEVPSPGHDDS